MTGLYEQLLLELPHPGLIFLNFGLWEPDRSRLEVPDGEERAHRVHLDLVRRVLGDTPIAGQRVLEIGCGRGGSCRYLAGDRAAGRVLGLDLCLGNAAFCTRVHGLDAATFLAGDAQRLPLATGSFDVVLNLESSHCYDDFAGFLAEVERVLKPAGVFCYADLWGLDLLRLDWQEREHALAAAGFEVLAEEDISEPVFQALKHEQGLASNLLAMADAANRELIGAMVQTLEAVRLHLAAGLCDYRLLRLRKP